MRRRFPELIVATTMPAAMLDLSFDDALEALA
jgi:hypothetical protein